MADARVLHSAARLLVDRAGVTDPRIQRMANVPAHEWNPVLVTAALPTLLSYSAALSAHGMPPTQLTMPWMPPAATPTRANRIKPVKTFEPLVYDHTIDGLRGIPITELAAVPKDSPKSKPMADRFATAGVATLYDLLTYVPRRYVERDTVKPINQWREGDEATVIATVEYSQKTMVGKMRAAKITVGDSTGRIACTFFRMPWKADEYARGDEVVITGKIAVWRPASGPAQLQMSNPLIDRTGSTTMPFIPIYPQSDKAQLTTWDVSRACTELVARIGDIADPVPVDVAVGAADLMSRNDAYRRVHTPEASEDREAARNRLAYDELLRMQLALGIHRRAMAAKPAVRHQLTGQLTGPFVSTLPFALTGAQKRVLGDIARDLRSSSAMNRLVQGDVGSGKTLVAVVAMLMAIEGGHQAALMAPTGVLASQHYAELTERLATAVKSDGTPVRVALLSNEGGRMASTRKAIAAGEVDIAVGTHALISDSVVFPRLGLVIIDEQHRFGVDQRAALVAKGPDGSAPDSLVMTATPVPRTAAMTVFGDLDVSVMDELPPGRTPILTTWTETVDTSDPDDPTWQLMRAQIAAGRQGYVVCPLVDDSETKAAASANTTRSELMAGALAGLRVGLIHGKMKPAERDEEMSRFKSGELDVIVATTVIEVGVNNPNATVIVILDPKSFGISQLHQLRGRVGRGSHASACVLAGPATTQEATARMAALVESTDGFWLSEQDLTIRGHGAILGSRQHGMTDLRVADLNRDHELLVTARADANRMLDIDATLTRWNVLRNEVEQALGGDAERYLLAN